MRPVGTVLVVEDDAGTRELLVDILEVAGFAALHASTGEDGLELARREPPRVAVVDVHLPGISGYEVCRALRESYRDDIAIVMVSGERTEGFDRVAGLLIGADDYLAKPFAPDELLERIRRLTRRLAPTARVLATRLTTRELEVLRLLAMGMNHEEIAKHLFISSKTVSTHVEHIFLKLGVQSRAQAVALAYRDDLVSITRSETAPPPAVTKRVSLRSLPTPAPAAQEADPSAVPVVAGSPVLREAPTTN